MVDEVPVAELVGLGREEELEEWHCSCLLFYMVIIRVVMKRRVSGAVRCGRRCSRRYQLEGRLGLELRLYELADYLNLVIFLSWRLMR